MTKFLLTITIISTSFSLQAQSWSLGGAAIYGDDIHNVGLHLRGYYNLANDKICFGPEYSYFLEKSETINGEEISKQLSEVNFNIHYVLEISEKWGVYPLTGANISFETEELEIGGTLESENVTKWGANLGIGVHRPVRNWVVFAEYDHLFSDLSQNSFLLGAFVTFGVTTKHE